MNCPVCGDCALQSVLTKQGVNVDACPKCSGIWLDKNEIYHFTHLPTYLRTKIDESLKTATLSSKRSPVNGQTMVRALLFDGDVAIDYCPSSQGIWLDKEDLAKLPLSQENLAPSKKEKVLAVEIDPNTAGSREIPQGAPVLTALPSLTLHSGLVLTGMYAVLTLFLIIVVETFGLDPFYALMIGVVFAFIQFILAPFLMDLSLGLFYRIRWVSSHELPEHLDVFLKGVCQKEKMDYPRIGIISDGAPNAFTYGHHPGNARIVLTQGLIDLLDEKELEAVVAHECGHIVHWDILVMTIVQLVPLILYYIYRSLIRMRSRGKGAGSRFVVAMAAYVLYIVSEYLVLYFSRLREYYADQYSANITGEPERLSQALVKIGYGLAGQDTVKTTERQPGKSHGVDALGIFDSRMAKALAIGSSSAASMGSQIDKGVLQDVAKWDLWNPWAKFYELHSTHPLIVNRLKYLSEISVSLGRAPYVTFDDRHPESYWDDFIVDVVIKFMPTIFLIGAFGVFIFTLSQILAIRVSDISAGVVNQPMWFGFSAALCLLGATYLIQILYSYPNEEFAPFNIRALLKKVKVSAVKPVACTVKGKIIGRGVPGLIFSEDFVMQDESGIIFLDYQQPLAIFNFFFGLLRAESYIGKEVEITGWYRRAPIPYIEIKKIKTAYDERLCYVYQAKVIFAWVLIGLGVCYSVVNLF